MNFDHILNNIPDYKTFFTVEELEENTLELHKKYPDIVEVFEIGKSREGRNIDCIKIGKGKKVGLMFACPHPNEPIGAMMLEYFTQASCQDQLFLDDLDYTWYIVKCIDPDGLKLNENWLKGPFSITNYIKNFFRPAGNVQVEWSFPMKYKNYNFDKPLPETLALMSLIEKIKPDFVYSLHNAGFGGVFWYINKEIPKIWNDLKNTTIESELPLHFGQPELPFCETYSDAIYKMVTGEDIYDYLEEFSPIPAEEAYTRGTDSSAFASKFNNSVSLITELPYFYDVRIKDMGSSERTKRDIIIESINQTTLHYRKLDSIIKKVDEYITDDNQFILLVKEQIKSLESSDEAHKELIKQEQFNDNATVAEAFDALIVNKFYGTLSTAMILRAIDYELHKCNESGFDDNVVLKKAKEEISDYLEESCSFLEKEMNYTVVSIKDLVRIQLESGLIVSQNI